MATALAVISVISAVAGAKEQRKQSRAQKKQNKLTNKLAAVKRQRDVRRSIAASRIQVGQQQSAGFQLGVSGGTAVLGGTAGVLSDTASGVGASNLQSVGQGFIAQQSDIISSSQGRQATFGAVSNVAGGLALNDKATAALTSLVG